MIATLINTAEMVAIAAATEQHVSDIVSTLLANRRDPSIFIRSAGDVRQHLKEFIVAQDRYGQCLGCAAVHAYSPKLGEIMSVAVLPEFHGQGVGEQLIKECFQRAQASGLKQLFLATAKPGYFARFDFNPISRWQLPVSVLLHKLKQAFQQPPERWWPVLFGGFQFMQYITGV